MVDEGVSGEVAATVPGDEATVDGTSDRVAAEQLAGDLLQLILGAIGLAMSAGGSILRKAVGVDGGTEAEADAGSMTEREPSLLALLPLAGLGVATEVGRRGAAAARQVAASTRPLTTFVFEHTPAGSVVGAERRWLEAWSERARREQAERERVAAAFVDALVTEVAAGVVNQLDLDGIIQRVDVNAVVARADIDAIVDRVDVQAIIDRIDLPVITKQVMDEVDVGEIIRESTGSITTETIDAIRYQGMNADRLVARIVDRVLMRRGGRDGAVPKPEERSNGLPPAPGTTETPVPVPDPI